MTSAYESFSDLRPLNPPQQVTIADGARVPATGIGRVHIRLSNKELLTLTDVLYTTPKFEVSLLSVDALNDTGLDVTFNARNRSCQIRHISAHPKEPWTFLGSRTAAQRTCFVYGAVEPQQEEFAAAPAFAYRVTTFIEADTSATVKATTPEVATAIPSAFASAPEPSKPSSSPHLAIPLSVWHCRFAHLNLVDLRKVLPSHLYKDDLLAHTGSGPHIPKYDICLLTKSTVRYQRKVRPQRATRPLELIHSDLCGPISPQSRSKARYFIIFVDDYTRSVDVYFLSSKSAAVVTAIFREYKAKKEKEFLAQGYKIMRFRCDNGRGEYDNDLFRTILSENGISFEPAPPYTQHKNGVPERMIQTICRKVRAMLLEAGLSASFWAEAVATAVYLINRTPTRSND